MTAIILTPTQLAVELDTDAKTTRKFLRDNARANEMTIPGKGARWEIKKSEVRSLKSRYNKWVASQEAAKLTRANKGAQTADLASTDAPTETRDPELPAED